MIFEATLLIPSRTKQAPVAWNIFLPPTGRCSGVTYLPVLLPHVGNVNISLREQPVTLPTRPPGTGHFLGFQCLFHGWWGFLFQLLFPVQGSGVLFVLISGILGRRLNAQRQVYTQVGRPFDAFQRSMHRLKKEERSFTSHTTKRQHTQAILLHTDVSVWFHVHSEIILNTPRRKPNQNTHLKRNKGVFTFYRSC